MAQYRATINDKVSRLGHKTNGIETKTYGWDFGIRVKAVWNENTECDEFHVYKTKGSNGDNGWGGDTKIGVYSTFNEKLADLGDKYLQGEGYNRE